VNRLFRLRPCDYTFEPHPDLPLGVGCVYAQVGSCAAPCLARMAEGEYRALAGRAAAWLADPTARADPPETLPAIVEDVSSARAVVMGLRRRELELYPVRGGSVLEDAAIVTPPHELEEAVVHLEWSSPAGPDDWPWLAGWIVSPRGRGTYVSVRAAVDRRGLVAALRAALPPRFVAPAADGNVGSSQGEA
jgi:hypothetical protein